MGKKSKHGAEAGHHLSGYSDDQYRDTHKNVSVDSKAEDLNKSVDCKRTKKRKRHKNRDNYHNVCADLARQDPTKIQKDHRNCAYEETPAQDKSFQDVSTNYIQSDMASDVPKKHSRKLRQTDHSCVLIEKQADVLERYPSTEMIEHAKKKRKKHEDSLKSSKKRRHVQNLNLEHDTAALAEEKKDSAQDCLRLELKRAEDSANDRKTEKRKKKEKYSQQKVSNTFQVENNIAESATQVSGRQDVADNENCGTGEKSLKPKMKKKKRTRVSTSSDVAEPNMVNSDELYKQKSAQCKLPYSEPGSSELSDKLTAMQRKKSKTKHNEVRDRYTANEEHGHNLLESNSNIEKCVISNTVTDKLTLTPINCGDMESNQQGTFSLNLGQWTNVQFAEAGRQNKFLRLLGGMKKSSLSFNNAKQLSMHGQEIRTKNVTNNTAMTTLEQERVNSVLEQQFEQARDQNFRKQRGTGLGFEHPPPSDSGKSVHIDASEVRSKRLDEDD